MSERQLTLGDVVRWKVKPYVRLDNTRVTHHNGTFVEYLINGRARVIIHNALNRPTGAIVRIEARRLELSDER